jgi:hypothetical protein
MTVLEGVEEFFDGAVLEGVDGDDLVMGKDDTNGDGYIVSIAFIEGIVFSRSLDDDELDIVVLFEAGAFIYV